MPTAFVTGATGFIGQHLVPQLLEQGWVVHALRRQSSPGGALDSAAVTWAVGDVTDADSLRNAMTGDYDAVFHLAGDTSMRRADRERQTRVNVAGTRHMLDAWRERGGCFVFTSSIAVWGLRHGRIDEDTPPHARSVERLNYARTKSLAEAMVRAEASEGRRALIVNPAHVMGPLDRHNWIRLFEMVAQNRVPAIAPGSGSFADVREVARAHIAAVSRARPGARYILGGDNLSFAEVVDAIARRLGVQVKAPRLSGAGLRAIARLQDWRQRLTGRAPDITPDEAAFVTLQHSFDSGRAIEKLGYRITPFSTLLDDTLQWAQENGRLA